MITSMISFGILSFIIAFFGTLIVRFFATRIRIVDDPKKHIKKIHKIPVPLLGGIGVYFAIIVCVAIALFTTSVLTGGKISEWHYIGFLLGGLVLMVGGYLDDRFDLPPESAILSPLIAALIVICFGTNVEKITNPFGGVIFLNVWQSNVLVFVWLLIVMYTTKFLDGLDGLATSVTTVGVLMVLLLSLTAAYFQPDVALLAVIVLGAELGFLFWNIHPASIFLGEGGSTLVGYLIGMLAIISGGKLATALLVLGIPLIDLCWVILRRLKKGGVENIFVGDRKHLHHRLLDLGWGQSQIVLLYVFIAGSFGILTLFLQSQQKIVAMILLLVIMFIAAAFLINKEKHVCE